MNIISNIFCFYFIENSMKITKYYVQNNSQINNFFNYKLYYTL